MARPTAHSELLENFMGSERGVRRERMTRADDGN
jgi:hypothetical protein